MKDFLGNELVVGDVVIRAKFATFSFHRIEKITKKRIQLSAKRETRKDILDHEYLFLIDSITPEDIINHNGIMYIPKEISNTNLIKYEVIRNNKRN